MYLPCFHSCIGRPGPSGAEGPAGKLGPAGISGRAGLRGPPGPPGITVLDGNARNCIKTELYQQITKEINGDLGQRLERERRLGLCYNYPADGCEEIVRNNPQSSDGWYWVCDSSDNSIRKVYCYPSGHTSCGEGVWMRIGYFNMRGNLAECPEPLERFAVNGSWYCRRTALPCTSVHFSALGKNYTAVCGMVEGYQYGSMDSFVHSSASKTPDDLYAEGTVYPSLMDPLHDAISGPTQWGKMPTLAQGTHSLTSAHVLQKGQPALYQTSLVMTITVILETPVGTHS